MLPLTPCVPDSSGRHADRVRAAARSGQHLELGSLSELAGVREAEQVVTQLCHLLLHRAVQAQRVAHCAHERQRGRPQLLLQGRCRGSVLKRQLSGSASLGSACAPRASYTVGCLQSAL